MLAQFLQFLFSGVTVGATYALAALGFTLIYNASNVINFAQGEMATFSTFIAWSLFWYWLRSFWHCTTMPVGMCVRRTAESVLLMC